MAHFEWENGAHATDRIGQSILLGRAEYADVRFQDDMGCSREQARLEHSARGWILQPLSQNTTTFLNDAVLGNATVLTDGDIVSFSAQRLIFRDDTPQEQRSIGQSAAPRHSTSASRQGVSGSSGDVIIGRSTDHANFILDHPAVSRRHALFRGIPNASIRDLGSTNGTYVNGNPVQGDHRLSVGDRIEIGPFSLVFDGASLELQSRPGEVALTGIGLCVDVPKPGGGVQTILDRAAVSIEPREFVCIVGPSGSGKSTLIRVLSGRNAPTRGTVRVGELDLFQNFESLKQEISFVPQHDVLHETLTLESALTYTAMLRLPVDTSTADRRLLVQAAARDVDLEDRLGNRISTLSGGQKNARASPVRPLANRGWYSWTKSPAALTRLRIGKSCECFAKRPRPVRPSSASRIRW